jgi:hypothetical protein
VRSRQGPIVAIATLTRRGGPAQSGDCTLATLERPQSIGEVVHRCGLPAQRRDLGAAVVDRLERLEDARDLRHERWLYPSADGRSLVLELREGRLIGAGWREPSSAVRDSRDGVIRVMGVARRMGRLALSCEAQAGRGGSRGAWPCGPWD